MHTDCPGRLSVENSKRDKIDRHSREEEEEERRTTTTVVHWYGFDVKNKLQEIKI